MIDFSHFNLLSIGGMAAVGAIIATCWRNIKIWFNYLSSFIIVQAHIDYRLETPTRQYIKAHYKPLPSGLLYYVGRYMNIKGHNKTILVPFRPNAINAIYYKKFKILIVSGKDNGITVRSFRGMINFNKLISDSLDFFEKNHETQNSNSRYFLRQVIGSEKLPGAPIHSQHHSPGNSAKVEQTAPEALEEYFPPVDIMQDVSFKYHRDLYMPKKASKDVFEGLFFDEEVMQQFQQAEQWMNMGNWYAERGIPWKRGVLLHGPAGTGKSTFSNVLAKKLGVPIYQYFLATLSDQEFINEWACMETPCVVSCDDIDTIWNKRESLTVHKTLTFECFLNTISGVSSSQGVYLVITTNYLDKIDPALGVDINEKGIASRPGRIDSVIRVGEISTENRKLMAKLILKDWPEEHDTLVEFGDGMTPAQFQEVCIQKAYDKISMEKN